MNDREDGLDAECRVFVRHILGCDAAPYVLEKYTDAHRVSAAYSTGSRFDMFLVRVAARNTFFAKLVDSYASVLAPVSLVRRKLVLILAILETAAPSCSVIDDVDGSSVAVQFARLCVRGVGSVLGLLVGVLVFTPARMILSDENARS